MGNARHFGCGVWSRVGGLGLGIKKGDSRESPLLFLSKICNRRLDLISQIKSLTATVPNTLGMVGYD